MDSPPCGSARAAALLALGIQRSRAGGGVSLLEVCQGEGQLTGPRNSCQIQRADESHEQQRGAGGVTAIGAGDYPS